MTALYRCLAVIAIFATVAGAVGAAAAQQRGIPVPPGQGQEGVQVNSIDLAQAAGSNVNLEIVSGCVNNVASFKIVNRGEMWPDLGKLKLFEINDGKTRELAARSMRFAQGQQASFRMKNPGQSSIGIFVEPSWYDRPFQFDAQVACR